MKYGSSQFPVLSSQGKQYHPLFRWLKFNAVGGIGIVVQLAVLAVLRTCAHLNYLVATALAVESAVVHNFFLHERFTWAYRPAASYVHSLLRLAKFNASNGAVSLLGNLLLMRLLVGEFQINYAAANLIAITVCSLVNFLLGDRFVFEREVSPATNLVTACEAPGYCKLSLRDKMLPSHHLEKCSTCLRLAGATAFPLARQ